MLDLSSPGKLIKSLEQFQGNKEAEALSFRLLNAEEIRSVSKKMLDDRYWGILPFAEKPDGDLLALFPFAGRELKEWLVVLVFPDAVGFRTIASSIQHFVSCFAIHSMAFEEAEDDFQDAGAYLKSVAEFMGDSNFGALLDAIRRKKITQVNFKSEGYPIADPNSAIAEFFRTFYKQIAEGANPLLTWRGYSDKFPRFMPGWKMYLRSGMMEAEIHESALSAAWRIVSAPYVRDNMNTFDEPNFGQNLGVLSDDLSEEEYNERDERLLECTWRDEDPILAAARLVLNDDLAPEAPHSVNELTEAIQEMVENEDYDGSQHLESSGVLERGGQLQLALDAARNANFWAFENNPETLKAAIRIAKSMNDSNLAEVLDLI